MKTFTKNLQYYKFCSYGFLKNLRFFDAFFILFLIEKDLSFSQIGILYAIREILTNVFEIPSGLFADKYGRKKSLLLCFFFFIVSFWLFYVGTGFIYFLLAFILYGTADAFRSGSHKGMIMDYLKLNNWSHQKIKYYGHTRSWSQLGSALSSLIAGLLVFYSGSYKHIFLYSIVPYLLNFLLILSYPKELDKSLKQKKVMDSSVTSISFKSLFQTIKQGRVLHIINTSAVHTAFLKSLKDYIQPLMLQISIVLPFLLTIETEKKSGIVIGVLYFIIYLLASRASKTASRFNMKNHDIAYYTLLLGFGAGIASGLFFYFQLWWPALLFFVAIYLIENVRKPILTGYVADQVPEEIMASVISAQSQLKTIFTALLSLFIGVFTDLFGIGIALIAVSLFLVSTSFLIHFIISRNKN